MVADLSEQISRELEYQTRRGRKPVRIEISPEVHEAMRLLARAPRDAVLQEHDGVPVRINRKMIGLRAWKIRYAHVSPPTEALIDAARKNAW
jgi:hypothetical protein